MNRFLPKKKVRAEAPVEDITKSETQPIQPVPAPHNWGWGKKKVPVPPKVEPVLPTPVIPLSENFRTSLIMPNLSARFSMLREQDDPASPLGKAKDDSVLSPKRRSRLIDFGHAASTLTDIVEVSATTDPIATPSEPKRKTSYTYGEANDVDDIFSTDNSIINRGRVGESNSLFGGRQKIYRVPSVSSGESRNDTIIDRESPRKTRARPLVDSDVGQSAFQKFREEEKLREAEAISLASSRSRSRDEKPLTTPNAETKLPFAYDAKRDTTSSSNSGPSTKSSSTAATVYSSQVPVDASSMPAQDLHTTNPAVLERARLKRLYEQGLAQHMYDQQNATLTRANSTKHKGLGISRLPSTSQSKNPFLVRDRLERSESAAARKVMPSLELDKLTTFESLRAPKSSGATTDKPSLQRPPLSPFDEESELTNILHEVMHPSDRGKATAMAHFQKPKKFDEQQYLHRQMSLLQQSQRRKRRSVLSPSKKPTFPGKSASPLKPIRPRLLIETRPRAGTGESDRSWSACSDHNESKEFTVTKSKNTSEENVACQSRSEEASMVTPGEDDGTKGDRKTNKANGNTSPMGNLHSPLSTPIKRGVSPNLGESSTPSPTSPEAMKERRNGWSPEKLMSGMASGSPFLGKQQYLDPAPVSGTPFLTAENAHGPDLKGLVRTHLRQTSNVSSISPSSGFQRPLSVFRNMPSMYGTGPSPEIDFNPQSRRDRLSPTPATRHLFPGRKDPISEEIKAKSGTEPSSESQRQHTRGSSTETQHERLAFAKELAERQRAIQENLRIKVENDGRSPSPIGHGRNVFEHPFKAFDMLRAISSRESMAQKHEPQVKSYGWVDMSAGEFENRNQAKEGPDIKVRSISPTGVGRTLHSRLREPKAMKPSDIRARRQRQGLSRTGIPERATPRKERFSRVLAESARNSIIALTSSERASTLRPDPPRTSEGDATESSLPTSDGIKAGSMAMNQQANTKAERPDSYSTPQRPTSNSRKPRTSADVDHTVEEQRESSVLEPNTPASGMPASNETQSPITATPSTVTSSTFSTPHLASSNASVSTPKTIDTSSTNSPRVPQNPPPVAYPKPPMLPNPPKPVLHRAPLSEFFSHSQNLRGRKPAYTQTSFPAIKKSDISDPTLIASTSTVDTVPLPQGASLRNGMSGGDNEVDAVLSARNPNIASTSRFMGSKEGLGLGMRTDVQHVAVRKPWEGKENERKGGVGGVGGGGQSDKDGVGVVKEMRGFLARMGRVASSEKKGAERW